MKRLLVIFALAVVCNAQNEDKKLSEKLKGILNAAGIQKKPGEIAELISLIKYDAIRLANKYNLYDEVAPLVPQVIHSLLAVPDNDPLGAGLAPVVGALSKVRDTLVSKASLLELLKIDSEIALLNIIRKSPIQSTIVDNLYAVFDAAYLNKSKEDCRRIILAVVQGSYEVGEKLSQSPLHHVNRFFSDISNIDKRHPLGPTLDRVQKSFKELALHLSRYLLIRGRPILQYPLFSFELSNLLVQAKSREDDTILDGLSGNQLLLFEQLVEALKDLKHELK
ncbi:unnamed protein product [Bursaphelenchus xylophilus]|nr:unnamed protein product [Bursaphelenchus xylophilus]CAG9092641.1 unnamed protein product [Bursaphelenchus xylophilus]